MLLMAISSHAQELKVKRMELAPIDSSASNYPRRDLNQNLCALVKVDLAVPGATFSGNVLGEVDYLQNEYWVYMSSGSYMLQIKHPNFLPLFLNFRDFDIRGVKSEKTYVLSLELPEGTVVVQQPASSAGKSKPHPEKESFTVNGVSFNMIFVERGTFDMGSVDSLAVDERPVHAVTLSDYYIGENEVTQELWAAVMGNNPSNWKGSDLPVESVSWNDCQAFLEKLRKITGWHFRLPTEAEWENAARGGKKSRGYKYAGSNDIEEVAWYMANSGDVYLRGPVTWDYWRIIKENNCRTHSVKLKQPNELGIYDMSGNVEEWCWDVYDRNSYSYHAKKNPTGPGKGYSHVCRGGGWFDGVDKCRSTNRHEYSDSESNYRLGLRLALTKKLKNK